MSPGTRLVLIRHGESVATVNRSIGGPRTCAGLSPLGVQQAEALRDRLVETNEIKADLLIASHYPRARQTAEYVAEALALPITEDDGVGEHDPGPEWDGSTFDQYIEAFGQPDWWADPYAAGFPGGETLAMFHYRVNTALHRIVRDHA